MDLKEDEVGADLRDSGNLFNSDGVANGKASVQRKISVDSIRMLLSSRWGILCIMKDRLNFTKIRKFI